MKLLHTGDLHLDSSFCAYGAKDAEKQRQNGRDLLVRIFECAKKEECQLILIAGDLFDSKFVSPESAALFCSLVENSGIVTAVSPGNHDFYTDNGFYAKAKQKLGDKLILFTSPELQIFDIDEIKVRLFGYAFTSPSLTQSPLSDGHVPMDNGYVRILCGHGDTTAPVSRYCPITMGDIEKFGFDYAALGHVHNPKEKEDENGRVRYCGFAEGRSFDELGEGGVWIVDTDRDKCLCKRVIVSKKGFFRTEADIENLESHSELIGKLSDISKSFTLKFGEGVHLRITLCGRADEGAVRHAMASVESIRADSKLAYLEIDDETMPYLDGAYLERDATLRGELYRILLPKLTGADRRERRIALKALKIGLAAIDGKNIFSAGE